MLNKIKLNDYALNLLVFPKDSVLIKNNGWISGLVALFN